MKKEIYIYGSGYERYVEDLKEVFNISFFFENAASIEDISKLIIIGEKTYYEYLSKIKNLPFEVLHLASVSERLEDNEDVKCDFNSFSYELEKELEEIIYGEKIKSFGNILKNFGKVSNNIFIPKQVSTFECLLDEIRDSGINSLFYIESNIINTNISNLILFCYKDNLLIKILYLNKDVSLNFITSDNIDINKIKLFTNLWGYKSYCFSSTIDENLFAYTLQCFKQNLEESKIEIKKNKYYFTFTSNFYDNISYSNAVKLNILDVLKVNNIFTKFLSLDKIDTKNGNWKKKLFVHQIINEESKNYVNFDLINSREILKENSYLYKRLDKQDTKICLLPTQQYCGLHVVTGRMYCLDKDLPLQNLSKQNRDILVPESRSHCFLNLDFKSFEYYIWHKIVLNRTDDEFNDPHTDILKYIFKENVKFEENDLKLLRNEIGKTTNFSVLYGQNINKTLSNINKKLIELKDTDNLKVRSISSILLKEETIKDKLFKELIKPSEKFKTELLESFKINNYIINHFNTKIFINNDKSIYNNNSLSNLLFNNYIQSTGFDFLNLVLFKIFTNEDIYNKCTFNLQQHDSILLTIKKDNVDFFVRNLTTIINNTDNLLKPKFKIDILNNSWI